MGIIGDSQRMIVQILNLALDLILNRAKSIHPDILLPVTYLSLNEV